MHKKIKPSDSVLQFIEQFPHCDQRVLHAPEDQCQYCNQHPEWQALRLAWGIAFTGYEPDDKELPCPATVRRNLETIYKWQGNIPERGETNA